MVTPSLSYTAGGLTSEAAAPPDLEGELRIPTWRPTPKSIVNHPAHYGTGPDDPYEVIKVLEAWLTPMEFVGALKFNIIKYQARANAKGGAEDLAKSAWYANRLDEFVKRTGYVPALGGEALPADALKK